MKLLFLNLSELKFTVATPDAEPLGGSESCLSYLARQLAGRGHDVTVLARLPDDVPAKIMGVRHGALTQIKDPAFFPAEKFDAIIASNAPVACPYLKHVTPQSRVILWDHVPPEQKAVEPLAESDVQKSIDCIVYVSPWQKAETEKRFGLTLPSRIIGNGLTPSFENMFASPKDLLAAKDNRAAYTTIPYRGLALLAKVMERLWAPTKLDVFSSMRVYQRDDDTYAPLFHALKNNPRITSYGSVPQPELARRLKPAAFLAYPCICAETFCISALEAIAAGMKVIATRLGALETTTMGYADLVDVQEGNAEKLIADFTAVFEKNITVFETQPEKWAEERFAQMQAVNQTCSWAARAGEWESLLANPV